MVFYSDDTPIPMLQIGRNKSSGTISSLTTRTRSRRRSFPATVVLLLQNHEADDNNDNKEKDADKADADATATSMMFTHNVTQSQINQNNHCDEELVDRDGGNCDEEGSLLAGDNAADIIIINNNNDELHVGIQDGYYYNDGTQVEEATAYPKPPQDYSPSDNSKSKLGEPSCHDVDNSGAWDRFCYQSKFQKESGGRYMYHKLPSEWNTRDGRSTTRTRFLKKTPLPSPVGTPPLDMAKLRKHGLQLGRLLNSDALFFYQLLLPFHADEEDKKQAKHRARKPFYSKVLKWSNNYANQAKTGKGHYVRGMKLSELVHFDGIVYLYGALEGKKGSICYRWTTIEALYPPEIAIKMSWYWWRQIKSNLKLNCNHEAKYNRLLCKDDMSKFNYAYKFDYIYETFVHNVNYFSKKACSDLCMDESSWACHCDIVDGLTNEQLFDNNVDDKLFE
eukprot:jgi/Psemu1/17093/gm1.17093_g